jgi:pimeloyl-ACP methyl ester carboxylesterase
MPPNLALARDWAVFATDPDFKSYAKILPLKLHTPRKQPAALAGAIEPGIPRACRVVLKDVGHLMYLEKPADFSRVVIAFIEQNQKGE